MQSQRALGWLNEFKATCKTYPSSFHGLAHVRKYGSMKKPDIANQLVFSWDGWICRLHIEGHWA